MKRRPGLWPTGHPALDDTRCAPNTRRAPEREQCPSTRMLVSNKVRQMIGPQLSRSLVGIEKRPRTKRSRG